jgi:hypothetical protein
MRKGNISVCKFRVPLPLPLERKETVVLDILQNRSQLNQGESALASQDILPLVPIAPQILDVDVSNRRS